MNTTVTVLLRDFPKVRRAAFAGERVVIETREGNLILMAEKAPGKKLLGCLEGQATDRGLEAAAHTLPASAWRSRG